MALHQKPVGKRAFGAKPVFYNFARVIKRDKFLELVGQGITGEESCLIIINREGETVAITEENEKDTFNIVV